MKTITMNFKKSTKNTHVYEDNTSNAPVPTLYVKREALTSPVPTRLKITIEEE